jgi:short-subunit dehydrogenase
MIAVVTGASSGLGKATAKELYSRGAQLVLSGRNEERLTETAKHCDNASIIAGDIADSRIADQLFQDLPTGALCAVFVAGSATFGPTDQFSDDGWKAAIDANLTGLFNCCRAAVREMCNRGGGKIVNVLSIAAKHPFPQSAAYVASKTGAYGLTRSLQAEYRDQGIAITAFIPGSTNTELWHRQDWTPNENDMIDPNDVARVIADIALDTSTGVYDEVVYMPPKGIL